MDYPSLKHLKEISNGSPETLTNRSVEYSSLLNGIWIDGTDKRTGWGRLLEIDKWITSVINKSGSSPFTFLEVGGSDGSTTYELMQHLHNEFKSEINAVILEKQLRLHCYVKNNLSYYLTHDNRPFLLQFGTIGVLLERNIGRMRFLFNPLVRIIQKCLKSWEIEKYLLKDEDILFINPLIRETSNIVWVEQNLFDFNESLSENFNLIRCSNILNREYFSDSDITIAIQLLKRYLKQGGFLVVSRSIDGIDGTSYATASIWRKHDNELTHVSDLNDGSEIKVLLT